MSRTEEFAGGHERPEREWMKVRADTVHPNGRTQIIAVTQPDGTHISGHVEDAAYRDGKQERGFSLHQGPNVKDSQERKFVTVRKREWVYLHLPTERLHGMKTRRDL